MNRWIPEQTEKTTNLELYRNPGKKASKFCLEFISQTKLHIIAKHLITWDLLNNCFSSDVSVFITPSSGNSDNETSVLQSYQGVCGDSTRTGDTELAEWLFQLWENQAQKIYLGVAKTRNLMNYRQAQDLDGKSTNDRDREELDLLCRAM